MNHQAVQLHMPRIANAATVASTGRKWPSSIPRSMVRAEVVQQCPLGFIVGPPDCRRQVIFGAIHHAEFDGMREHPLDVVEGHLPQRFTRIEIGLGGRLSLSLMT